MLNFNIEQNCQSLSISPEIYQRILKKAIVQTTDDVKNLKEAVEQENFESIGSISHRLKGDYANLRIDDMSSIAKDILEESKGEKNREKITSLFSEFVNFFDELKEKVPQAE